VPEFLDRLTPRLATALRLAGLAALVTWQLQTRPAPGLSGRHLLISVLLAAASLTWLDWAWRWSGWSEDGPAGHFDPAVLGMALSGGLLVGAAPAGPGNVFMFVAAFSAGVRLGVPRGLIAAALAWFGLAVLWIPDGDAILGIVAYTLGLIALTFAGAQRHDALRRREQAELLLVQTQRSHEEQLRNVKLEEASRLAREIHDVLAHSLAGLTIQLEATASLIEAGAAPETVLARVRTAHQLAREGLRETRLAVGALRGEGAPPVPAASRIEALVSDFAAAGGAITLELDAARSELHGEVGDAAVRIVQEALTNALKHAPGARVQVALRPGPPLSVIVDSELLSGVGAHRRSLAVSGGGFGITGMRERAVALGGTLSAGPNASGWRVEATLGRERG
jgi:signal transduction histidine kinase